MGLKRYWLGARRERDVYEIGQQTDDWQKNGCERDSGRERTEGGSMIYTPWI